MKSAKPSHCDIFCHVVDNFGDIGVTWRLAKQLYTDFGIGVRLIVDDLAALQKLVPSAQTGLGEQWVEGIFVRKWQASMDLQPSPWVIEGFGCALPDAYIDRMAAADTPPLWLNLEYLTAEAWTSSYHLLPSIHPPTGLRKVFFFPGFGEHTGGLLRERDLLDRRNRLASETLRPARSPLRVFLFCYENRAMPALIGAFKGKLVGSQTVECTIPPGEVMKRDFSFADGPGIRHIEFVAQADFDRILWTHDVLFVRGEDSFVRAQWAAKPFIWQIYPQEEGAHQVKLDAFLDCYCAKLSAPAASALRQLTQAWNDQDGSAMDFAWTTFTGHLEELRAHALEWSKSLAEMPDLATRLVTFCEKTARI